MADYASGFGELGKNLLISSVLRRQAQEAHKQALTKMLTPIMVNMIQQRDQLAMQEKVANINAESARLNRETSLQEAQILASARRYNTDMQYQAKIQQIEAQGEKQTNGTATKDSTKHYLEYYKRQLKGMEKTQSNIESDLKSKRKDRDKLLAKQDEIPPGTLAEKEYKEDLKSLQEDILELNMGKQKNQQEITRLESLAGYTAPPGGTYTPPDYDFSLPSGLQIPERLYYLKNTGERLTKDQIKNKYHANTNISEFEKKFQIALQAGIVE